MCASELSRAGAGRGARLAGRAAPGDGTLGSCSAGDPGPGTHLPEGVLADVKAQGLQAVDKLPLVRRVRRHGPCKSRIQTVCARMCVLEAGAEY